MLCISIANRALVLAEARTGVTAPSKGNRTEPRKRGSCCWLPQVQGILANTVEQKRAFAEFQRLHEKSLQPERMSEQTQPSEVT
jgi:hypothetical protein